MRFLGESVKILDTFGLKSAILHFFLLMVVRYRDNFGAFFIIKEL